MRIARYWEKATQPTRLSNGKTASASAWGWSPVSREDAARNARAAALRVAELLQTLPLHDRRQKGGYYPDRPPREEILREISNAQGEISGLLTRNSYGAVVLSTPGLMFIDVDVPFEGTLAALSRGLQKLFGRKNEAPPERIQREILETAKRHSRYSFRLYRTSGGFRCIVINQVMAPESAESHRLLEEFGADELYQKLCRAQQCYRARLSPKFWRCGARRPPNRFPQESSEEEKQYRDWQSEYEKRISNFAVCRFLEQIGRQNAPPELQSLIALHDEATKASSDLPLA
jgi:hypothetical protein